MVSAQTSDVSTVQKAHKTQQLMRSKWNNKAVSCRLHCVTKWTNYLSPRKKTNDFSKHEYFEFKLNHPPFSGEMIRAKHSYDQLASNMTMLWVQTNSLWHLNTLRTGDADLRFHITTVQDGWCKSAFLTRACFPCTVHLIMQYTEPISEWSCWRMFIETWPHSELTFRHRASYIYRDRHFATLQRTLFIYLINKYISLSDICLTVHHWYK